ncbi:MAG TPA: hypothetical protein VF461_24480 [Gemmatimonadaceae bacterium]
MIRAWLALAALSALPSALAAQQGNSSTPAGVVAPAADSVGPFERPDGTHLRAGTSTFRLTLQRDGRSTPLGTRTVDVGESQLGGTTVWVIAERREGTVVPTSDSLWLTRTELSPERWVASIDRTKMAASFSKDSMFGAIQSYEGRASFSSAVAPGALITPGMTERVVELLPLHVGYHALATLLLLDSGTPRTLPAELIVEREERVHAGGGDVDAWVVLLRAGSIEERLWVSKSDRRVVRTEQHSSTGVVVGEAI